MKIGEVALASGVSASRIRFYEARGLLGRPLRASNGYRDYSPDMVGLLRFIERAQRLGFTLREIQEARPVAGEHQLSCDALLVHLRGKLDDIEEFLVSATARRDEIPALFY